MIVVMSIPDSGWLIIDIQGDNDTYGDPGTTGLLQFRASMEGCFNY